MDTSREKILQALRELIGRKDASVFQSADNFERLLQKIGGWAQLAEITALKNGLQERLPWELQKGAAGPVSRALINSLAANISRKHQQPQELAVWAVESWALALGIKYEAEPMVEGARASAVQSKTAGVVENSDAWRVFEKSRAGIIFGSDAQGVIKVFKSWWRPASETEIASLRAVAVKVEPPVAIPLFAAAPTRRQARPGVTQIQRPVAALEASSAHATPVKTTTSGQASTGPVPLPAAHRVAVPAAHNVAAAKPASPVVLTGSAEELCAQAKALLPGYGSRVDIQAALQMLQQAAKLGSVPARRMLGEIHHKGLGVRQDFATAANWFRLAADAGDAHAQFYLGTLYQCGMGVEFNLAKAQDWLQKAAAQGHKEAKTLLQEILQA